jgi:hypothetical protein
MKRLNRALLLTLLLIGLVVWEAVGEELRDATTVDGDEDYERRIRKQLEEFIESQYEEFEEEAEEFENKQEERGEEGDSMKVNFEKLKTDFMETAHKIKEAVDKFVAEQQEKYPPWFIERLSTTNALNFDQVLTELKLQWHYFPQVGLNSPLPLFSTDFLFFVPLRNLSPSHFGTPIGHPNDSKVKNGEHL